MSPTHPVKKLTKGAKPQKKMFAKKFCPNCGKPIDKGTMCKNCHHTEFNFKDIKVVRCERCSRYFHKNKWHHYKDFTHAVKHVVDDNVKHPVNAIHIEDAEKLLSYKAGVRREFTIETHIKHDVFDIPGHFEVTICPNCAKQGTQYFQCIMQVRRSNAEINAFIRSECLKQKKKGIHINKEERLDKYSEENIDFYLTDQKYAKVLAEKLRKVFGATIKKNAELFSINWETSKNLYRLNMLVEIPLYKKNDVIKKDNHLYKVVSLDSKVHVVSLKTNTKTLLPHKDYDVLKPVEVLLIKKYPEYEVLDPTTYYQARLMNGHEKLDVNQKILVIIDAGEAWMV